jgi:ribosome maturation factor RimP
MDQAGLETLIAPTIEPMGYTLVRVRLSGSPHIVLQVMAERADGRPMAVEDCEAISRALSAKLDVEDPIAAAYTLEVSSPGIDRPLVRPQDYRRFAGHVARVETRVPVEGRRRFLGRIAAATDSHVRLTLDEAGADGAVPEIEIPIADIARAKLKLTDELIAAANGRH